MPVPIPPEPGRGAAGLQARPGGCPPGPAAMLFCKTGILSDGAGEKGEAMPAVCAMAAPSVSAEGNHIRPMQRPPVSAGQPLMSKLKLHLMPAMPPATALTAAVPWVLRRPWCFTCLAPAAVLSFILFMAHREDRRRRLPLMSCLLRPPARRRPAGRPPAAYFPRGLCPPRSEADKKTFPAAGNVFLYACQEITQPCAAALCRMARFPGSLPPGAADAPPCPPDFLKSGSKRRQGFLCFSGNFCYIAV